MLPPGHIAGGYLAAYALLKIAKPDLSGIQIQNLIYWSMFFSFAPDLDSFISFARGKALIVADQKHNHRKYYSHAPVLWLIAGLLIYFLSASVYGKTFGSIVWLASWSHFLLDSVDYGIMWLWPLSSKVYSLRNPEIVFDIPERGFFGYWWHFVKLYTGLFTFYLEILIVIAAFYVFIK